MGKDQAQPSPTLMLENSDTRSILAQNSLRLASVKGKKGVARSRSTNGIQGSAAGVQSSNRISLNHSQVSSDRDGNDGHLGGTDSIQFTVGTGSSRCESGEMDFCSGQGVCKADPFVGFLQPSAQGCVEGEQAGVGRGVDHRGFLPGVDSVVFEGMRTVGEGSTADLSSLNAMQCEAKASCEVEGMDLKVRGAREDPQC